MGCGTSSNMSTITKQASNKIGDLYGLEENKSLTNNNNFGSEKLKSDLFVQKRQFNKMFKKLSIKSRNLINKVSSSKSVLPVNSLFESDTETTKKTNLSSVDQIFKDQISCSSKNKFKITNELLQQFLELEQLIQVLERKQVVDDYLIQTDKLENFETRLDQVKINKYRCLEDLISIQKKMGHSDLKSVKSFVLNKINSEDTLNLEEELFLDALNKKETYEKELDNLLQEKDILKQKIEDLTLEKKQLDVLLCKRDNLLDEIFDGQFGSELENQLEQDLDVILDQKHYIDQAYFRWKQAYLNSKQACKFLAQAIDNWKNFSDTPYNESENEPRYQIINETRNLLLSANQQLQNCHQYLNNIDLPYCSQEEMETLDKAITYIFTDINSQERHQHALNCYESTFKRSNALKQWIEQVLNLTITRDLYMINEVCKIRTSELRNERMRLIKNRIAELNHTSTTNLNIGTNSELEETIIDEQLAKIINLNKIHKDEKSFAQDSLSRPFSNLTFSCEDLKQDLDIYKYVQNKNYKDFSTDKHKTLDEISLENISYNKNLSTINSALNDKLAPMPSSEQIFGRINELKKCYKNTVDQVRRQKQFSEAKIVQGLKKKLNERRHRRNRAQMNEREVQALNV